jgi:hypothetical protein
MRHDMTAWTGAARRARPQRLSLLPAASSPCSSDAPRSGRRRRERRACP